MRVLGVDFGFKRIGMAVTDTEIGLPTALQPLEAKGALKKDAEQIANIARKEGCQSVVVGLPIEQSGEEGRMARICRQLADLIAGHGLEVRLVDEGMTTWTVEQRMVEAGIKASDRKKIRDSQAAVLILERFLSE